MTEDWADHLGWLIDHYATLPNGPVPPKIIRRRVALAVVFFDRAVDHNLDLAPTLFAAEDRLIGIVTGIDAAPTDADKRQAADWLDRAVHFTADGFIIAAELPPP